MAKYTLTPAQKKAVARIQKPFKACARKLGFTTSMKKWTRVQKNAIRACMLERQRTSRSKSR